MLIVKSLRTTDEMILVVVVITAVSAEVIHSFIATPPECNRIFTQVTDF